MGKLKFHHIFETLFWFSVVIFLYYHSFKFDKEIEIYRYGASAWPRAILLCIALVTLGQLIYYWRKGDGDSNSMLGSVMEDSAEKAKRETEHSGVSWYLSTFIMLSLPFLYMNLPKLITGIDKPNDPELNQVKLICAGVLIVIYLILMWRNRVGGILALPLLFAAMLQDMGFYALGPAFIVGVMFLMGEKRITSMAWVMPVIMGLLLLFFVKLLYVGLPTGYVKPFYDFGNWVVTILQ